jgi:hypothetical protein
MNVFLVLRLKAQIMVPIFFFKISAFYYKSHQKYLSTIQVLNLPVFSKLLMKSWPQREQSMTAFWTHSWFMRSSLGLHFHCRNIENLCKLVFIMAIDSLKCRCNNIQPQCSFFHSFLKLKHFSLFTVFFFIKNSQGVLSCDKIRE